MVSTPLSLCPDHQRFSIAPIIQDVCSQTLEKKSRILPLGSSGQVGEEICEPNPEKEMERNHPLMRSRPICEVQPTDQPLC